MSTVYLRHFHRWFKRSLFNLSESKAMSSLGNKFSMPDRLTGSETTVWSEFIKLATEYRPLDLGHGFPDFDAPEHITKAFSTVALDESVSLHQYTRGRGHFRLVTAISKLYSRVLNRDIDPVSEVMVGAGAFQALYCTILGHIKEGDEVIIVEPFFDCYAPMVKFIGGTPVFIALRPTKREGTVSSGDWKLDAEELAGLFNEKTKAIILNTPNNPLGKVFTLEELMLIADLCKKWNVLCISDEVYEWVVFKPHEHIRIASLPGMWDRTITIGSAGKTFCVTGWKIGWAYGPANLIRHLFAVHLFTLSSCNTPTQEAVAQGLEYELARFGQPDCYFETLPNDVKQKRDYFAQVLSDIGMIPVIPEGGYFILADWTPLRHKVNLTQETDEYEDYRFTKWITKNLRLQGIPPSAFYSKEHKYLGENFVRFCFVKKDCNLQMADRILKTWVEGS